MVQSEKNRKEVPRELVPSRPKRAEYESVFAFTSDAVMVSYSPKKNKTVLLLSTMHKHPEVDTNKAKKPLMILDYNATKGAVDAFDQQVGYYTCARKTRRWPMRLFDFIIDAACLNAFVVWNLKNPQWKNHKGSTRLDKAYTACLRSINFTPTICSKSHVGDRCTTGTWSMRNKSSKETWSMPLVST